MITPIEQHIIRTAHGERPHIPFMDVVGYLRGRGCHIITRSFSGEPLAFYSRTDAGAFRFEGRWLPAEWPGVCQRIVDAYDLDGNRALASELWKSCIPDGNFEEWIKVAKRARELLQPAHLYTINQNAALEAEVKRLADELNRERDEHAKNCAALVDANKKLAALRAGDHIKFLESELHVTLTRYANAVDSLARLDRSLAQERDEHAKAVRELEGKIIMWQKSSGDAQVKLQDAQQEARRDQDALRCQVSMLQDEIEGLNGTIAACNKGWEDALCQRDDARRELERERLERADLENKVANLERYHANEKARREQAEGKLEGLRHRKTAFEVAQERDSEVSALRADIYRLKGELFQANQHCHGRLEQINELRGLLTLARKKYDDFVGEQIFKSAQEAPERLTLLDRVAKLERQMDQINVCLERQRITGETANYKLTCKVAELRRELDLLRLTGDSPIPPPVVGDGNIC